MLQDEQAVKEQPDAFCRTGISSRWHQRLIVIAIVMVVAMIVARWIGPSDLFDQTQPRTLSYTADIIANGNWVLPIERGEVLATKPPLYNWLAAPFVALAGSSSELAHKFPSVLSFLICWLLIVRLGREVDHDPRGTLGWVAGMAFALHYTMFKLAWLARPDMLLTMWLLLGWLSVTRLLIAPEVTDERQRFRWKVLLWCSVGLAALTKGPAAVVIILYAVIAGRYFNGTWRAVGRLGWSWGMPLALLPIAAWAYAAWQLEPVHVQQVLWYDEIVGRILGTGPEGSREGFSGWVRTLPNMMLYFLLRFMPWSLLALAGIIWLMRSKAPVHTQLRTWLIASTILIVVAIVTFTLSAGKRADYIAIAYGPGSIVSAWFLLDHMPRFVRARPWVIAVLAAGTLATLIAVNELDLTAPQRRFGDVIDRFVAASSRTIANDPAPVMFWNAGGSHVQAMLGSSTKDGSIPVAQAITDLPRGSAIWVIAGTTTSNGQFLDWVTLVERELLIQERVVSETAPRVRGWPGQLRLYRVSRPAED